VFNKMFNIGSVQTVGLLLGASKASLELKWWVKALALVEFKSYLSGLKVLKIKMQWLLNQYKIQFQHLQNLLINPLLNLHQHKFLLYSQLK
jgi:hypothetical protein